MSETNVMKELYRYFDEEDIDKVIETLGQERIRIPELAEFISERGYSMREKSEAIREMVIDAENRNTRRTSRKKEDAQACLSLFGTTHSDSGDDYTSP